MVVDGYPWMISRTRWAAVLLKLAVLVSHSFLDFHSVACDTHRELAVRRKAEPCALMMVLASGNPEI